MLFGTSAFSQLPGIWAKRAEIKLDHHTIRVSDFFVLDSQFAYLALGNPTVDGEPWAVCRSSDGGVHWQKNPITKQVSPYSFFVTPGSRDTLLVAQFGLGTDTLPSIIGSYDGGVSWNVINEDSIRISNLVMWDGMNGMRTYLDTSSYHGIAEFTYDGGKTFSERLTDPIFLYYHDTLYHGFAPSVTMSFYISRISERNAVAVMRNSAVTDPLPMLYTTDAGKNWHEATYPDTLPIFTTFLSYNTGYSEIVARESGPIKDFYHYSNDTGTTWHKSKPFRTKLFAAQPTDSSSVCIIPAGFRSVVAYTSDAGNTWVEDSTSFTGFSANRPRFIGSNFGLTYCTFDNALPPGDSTIHIFNYISTKNSVAQDDGSKKNISYPNPASSYIHLIVDGLDNVRFSGKVYDALGKEFIISYNQGHTGILCDVSNLPSGTYSCSLTTNNTIYSHSFIVSR
jgi:hypothetical protein